MAGRNKIAAEAYLRELELAPGVVRARVPTALVEGLRNPIYEPLLDQPLFPQLVYGRPK